ncbi:hypothetical protein ACOSQ4_018040 [Xanthoceras sorbifolium]
MMKKTMIVDKLLRRAASRILNLPVLVDHTVQTSSVSNHYQNPCWFSSLRPTTCLTQRFLCSASTQNKDDHQDPFQYDDEEETTDGWEEEDEVDPEVGDGGDGGGVVLQGCSWGDQALSIAHDVLFLHAADDIKLYAFKTTPRGYVYVRLDKLSHKYLICFTNFSIFFFFFALFNYVAYIIDFYVELLTLL